MRALDGGDLASRASRRRCRSRGRSPQSAGLPVSTAVSALAAVVLPMPISPTPSRSRPVWPQLRDEVEPDARSRGAHPLGTSPGPRSCRPFPARILARTSRRAPADRLARPLVRHVRDRAWRRRRRRRRTSAPAAAARALIAAPPATKLATICAVTSDGYADTPWRTTPWSAGRDDDRPARDRRIHPAGDARQLDQRASSRRPRLPGGLVSRSRWAAAAAIAVDVERRDAGQRVVERSGVAGARRSRRRSGRS